MGGIRSAVPAVPRFTAVLHFFFCSTCSTNCEAGCPVPRLLSLASAIHRKTHTLASAIRCRKIQATSETRGKSTRHTVPQCEDKRWGGWGGGFDLSGVYSLVVIFPSSAGDPVLRSLEQSAGMRHLRETSSQEPRGEADSEALMMRRQDLWPAAARASPPERTQASPPSVAVTAAEGPGVPTQLRFKCV